MKICQVFIFSICLIVIQWSIAEAQLPCGLYEADGGIYDSFNFGDNMQVTVDAGVLQKTTYSVKDDKIFLKVGLRLKIVDDNTLIGVCTYTKGSTYKRVKKSLKQCKSDPAIIESQNCYREAVDLRTKGKLSEAAEQYKKCCEAGDKFSCNEYAVIKQLIDGDTKTAQIYYKKACDMGLGVACANLASDAFRAGKNDKGMKLLKEACDKGHTASCAEIILQKEQKE